MRTGEAAGLFGNRGFWRGASLTLTQKRDVPDTLKIRELLLTWLTTTSLSPQPNFVAFTVTDRRRHLCCARAGN
jgi:hypothetical protein